MGFRSFLFAMLVPPIFLFVHGRVVGGIFSLIFWLAAWILLVTVIGAVISPLVYAISFLPAAFELRRRSVEEAAQVIAEKMATAMRQEQPVAKS